MLYQALARFFSWFLDYWNVIRPGWVAFVFSAFLTLILFTGQMKDVLLQIQDSNREIFTFYLSLILLTGVLWYFPRVLMAVKYPFTRPSITSDKNQAIALWFPRVIALLPQSAITLVYLREGYSGYAMGSLLLIILSMVFFIMRRSRFLDQPYIAAELTKIAPRSYLYLWGLIVFSFVLMLAFILSPIHIPLFLGSMPIILFAFCGWVAFASLILSYPAQKFNTPTYFFLFLTFALFSLTNDNHHVRGGPGERPERPEILSHFNAWLDYRRGENSEKPYPVIIVATEGGGSRAAYWTAVAISTLEQEIPGITCHIYAISGVSGGSLGAGAIVATYKDKLIAQGDTERCKYATDKKYTEIKGFANELKGMLGKDFYSPTMAGMLFPDLVQRFLPVPFLPDRASFLEKSWAWAGDCWRPTDDWFCSADKESHYSQDFMTLWQEDWTPLNLPAVFLNGTHATQGNRVIVSNVDFLNSGPGQKLEFLYVRDLLAEYPEDLSLPLTTAIDMSTRFTYVGPAGRVTVYDKKNAVNKQFRIVDGGYYENSGTETAREIIQSLNKNMGPEKAIFIPLVISYEKTPAIGPQTDPESLLGLTSIINEVLAPPIALASTRPAHAIHAIKVLDDLGSLEPSVQASVKIILSEHTGGKEVKELPLGWMLSRESIGIINKAGENLKASTVIEQLEKYINN